MRVPLSWLRDYVEFDLPAERLAERLTILGMEVQAIERIGADWRSIVVGELLEVAPHPTSDRLLLTRVRVSEADEPLSIVCGATNIAVGQRVPVALPGAILPGGRQIGISSIHGTESRGMLCSGAELGLTADADGILILSADGQAGQHSASLLPTLGLGRPLEEVVGDVVLDIDVKPNRGDALSLVGLAREVAAISGSRLRWPEINLAEAGDATADHVSVEVEDERLCPRFVARYVDGLAIGPSPIGVQLRLSAAGMRPLSNAVDATNYVMLELGKPIHVFDADAVEAGHVVVRPARNGERIETLDHVVRELTPETLLIADQRGPLGIAGVMGGAQSEVSEATSAAIVESAVFDAVSIRRTAQRFGLRSEASNRFEKGQESRLARVGADRTAQLLAEWAGGRVASGAIDTNPVDEQPRRVVFRPSHVDRLLGADIDAAEMREALARVEIETERPAPADRLSIVDGEALPLADEWSAEALVAIVPPHRRDVAIEADVAEEICRLRGYESLPPRRPDTQMPQYRTDPRRLVDELRVLLAGRGLAEVVTNGLIAPIDHERLGFAAADEATIRVANPVTADHSEMRRSLLPGLLGVLARNERQRRDDVAVFEVGGVHEWVQAAPSQSEHLGILLGGDWQPASWVSAAHAASVEEVKGICAWLADRLNFGRLDFQRTTVRQGIAHPGRTAAIVARGNGAASGAGVEIGRVGELHPAYLAACDVRSARAVFALIELEPLGRLVPPTIEVRSLFHLPAVERDLAVVVARDTPQASVAEVIREHAGPLLAGLTLFDRYHGPPLAETEVSLAYRLRFQPTERTPTDSELEALVDQIGAALAHDVDGRIRSGS